MVTNLFWAFQTRGLSSGELGFRGWSALDKCYVFLSAQELGMCWGGGWEQRASAGVVAMERGEPPSPLG